MPPADAPDAPLEPEVPLLPDESIDPEEPLLPDAPAEPADPGDPAEPDAPEEPAELPDDGGTGVPLELLSGLFNADEPQAARPKAASRQTRHIAKKFL
jgi:hypothetical protein